MRPTALACALPGSAADRARAASAMAQRPTCRRSTRVPGSRSARIIWSPSFRGELSDLLFLPRDLLVLLDHVQGQLLDLLEETHVHVRDIDAVSLHLASGGHLWKVPVLFQELLEIAEASEFEPRRIEDIVRRLEAPGVDLQPAIGLHRPRHERVPHYVEHHPGRRSGGS